jgi:hypothetical protein
VHERTLGLEKANVHTLADQVAGQFMRYIEPVELMPAVMACRASPAFLRSLGVGRRMVRKAIRDRTGKGVPQVVGRGAVLQPIEVQPLQGHTHRATLAGSDDTVSSDRGVPVI